MPPSSARRQRLIAPGSWLLLLCSGCICLFAIFVSQWSSSGPTLFPAHVVNETVIRQLPAALRLPHTLEQVVAPVVLAIALCLGLRWVPSNNWTRLTVKTVVLILLIRYSLWRFAATLNLYHWFSQLLSLSLISIESVSLLSTVLYLFQTSWSTETRRQQQADQYEKRVKAGVFCPSVDIFIPTYNESELIVKRTVMGAQAMRYGNAKIYILDDTRRPKMKALAAELGCEYITRPDNRHAKAGNLNHALQHTEGELIALLDADFVPFWNFLERTVGFFEDPRITLVQTPQYFYNVDYHARNLGLENTLPNDLEYFYGSLQSHRDTSNSTICCGSSYVIRRQAIEAIDGYFTKCCVEDYQTSLKLLLNRARIIYLNEVLSMGESTRTFADFLDQRLRWIQGNYQVYFCGKDLPWWKLNFLQKTFLLNQFLYCFQPFVRFGFLVIPLISLYSGVSPFVAPFTEILYYSFPLWILLLALPGWSTHYRTSQFWLDVYETAFCFPGLMRMIKIMFNPFAKVSKVTRKGVQIDRKNYNWPQNFPLMLLLTLNLTGMGLNLYGARVGWWSVPEAYFIPQFFWLSYNSLLIVTALLSSIDQPVRRTVDRFPLQLSCQVGIQGNLYNAYTLDLSEQGAKLLLAVPQVPQLKVPESKAQPPQPPAQGSFTRNQWVTLTLPLAQEVQTIQARVVRYCDRSRHLHLEFADVPLTVQRRLVEQLYGNPQSAWKERRRIGGMDSLLALLTAVVQLRPILRRYRPSHPSS